MQTDADSLFAPRQGRILVVDDAPANIQAVTAIPPRETQPGTDSSGRSRPIWQSVRLDDAVRQQSTDGAQGLSAAEAAAARI